MSRAAGCGEGTFRNPWTRTEHACPSLRHRQSPAQRQFGFPSYGLDAELPEASGASKAGETASGLVHTEETAGVGRRFRGAPGSARVPGLRGDPAQGLAQAAGCPWPFEGTPGPARAMRPRAGPGGRAETGTVPSIFKHRMLLSGRTCSLLGHLFIT